MASQSIVAHIMKPVVNSSISAESFSSAETWSTFITMFGGCDMPSGFPWIPVSGLGERLDYLTEGIDFGYSRSEFSHVDGRSRRLHLVRRQARALEGSQYPRPHPLAALRPRRLRGRPRLQDRVPRHRDLPAEGAHRPALQLGQDLHDGDAL